MGELPVSHDVICFYADFGRPYRPLLDRMVLSAKQVMPDARVICATPTPKGDIGSHWDAIIELPDNPDIKTLCYERARFTTSWMLRTDRAVIFTDPDIEFKKPVPVADFWDIGLLWRRSKPDQPINEGIVIAHPGHPKFWTHYGKIVVNLPKVLRWWWCDQIAFSILTGACHEAGDILSLDDAQVQLIDGETYCPNSDKPSPEAWALHYKGQRKGEGWDKVFISKKSGAGRSSAGSASSMDGQEVLSSVSPLADSLPTSALASLSSP